ncbi:hypothetical protein GCM10011608_59240 [Micromonospora sonchi]|uniref:DUF3558 domain-containing protein n=1 Tax=Micromonospora sonchi TaxID=1763543 RepID=A0A917UA84_9ACTN|nr:hypothetical protein [Micromonospora sonchi]GGM66081.1 hypothetical protein GCM10011608_59240 [Micromonospora sonchi]
MRRLILPAVFATVLALTGCDRSEPPPPAAGADADLSADDAGLELPADDTEAAPPACPFTAEQVAEFVGQPMVDQGNCSFGDGEGVALFTVTMASGLAGESTYDYQRQQADQSYQDVTDLGDGKGYLAVKELGAEAVVINDAGAFTVTLSSFQRLGAQPDGYQQALRRVLDGLPS